MLIGQYSSQIDHNDQFNIPATFLNYFVSGAIATYGLDSNLFLFPSAYWEYLANEIIQLPLSSEAARSFRRFLFSNATNLTPDKKGRISLSPQLKRFAGIEQKIMIVGVHSYIEVWDMKAWELERNKFIDSPLANKKGWEKIGI